jgi:hypothetical protein
MAIKKVKRGDGATTIIKDGRIAGNLPGLTANAPSAVDDIVSMLSTSQDIADTGTDVAVLHDLYVTQQSVRTDGDFLAPSDSIPMNIGCDEDGISNDLFVASEMVQGTFGVGAPGERFKTLKDSAQAIGVHRDTRLLPPDEAAMEVSLAMSLKADDKSHQAFLDKIRSGEINLTVSEVAVLQNIRNEVMSSRAAEEASAVPFDDEGVWSPPYENRHCTQCGQFVGELGTHINCRPRIKENLQYSDEIKTCKGTFTVVDEESGTARKIKFHNPTLGKNLSKLSTQELQDSYLASAHHANRNSDSMDTYMCGAIIGHYLRNPLFGDTRLELPREIRDAYLATNQRHPGPGFVAQLIHPPFTPSELEHLIDSDRSASFEDTNTLLASPRARSDVLRILENTPSPAGKYLASVGALPTESVRNMASSGDAAVRIQATEARNLPNDEALRLATDPDWDIRRNMMRKIEDFPEALQIFLNDPDEDLAVEALAQFPGQRSAAVAISKVTSRKRLQAIHDRLPEIWLPSTSPSHDNATVDGSHPRVQAVKSVQEWIRGRLAEA